MASSYGGIAFTVITDGFQESREGRVGITEIPGGDLFYVDLAGRAPPKLTVNIVLANYTLWSAMNALLGQEQTLIVDTLNTHLAVLMSVTRPAPEVDGQIQATASFVITG